MTSTRTILVFATLLLLPAATCGSQYRMPPSAQRTVAHAIAIPATARRLEVQFHDGLLAVEPGETPSCDLEVHLQASDDEQLDEFERAIAPVVSYRESDATATVHVALPAGADLAAVRTTWRVRAPANLAIAATTRLGGVVVRGTSCDLRVDGGSGVVEANLAGGTAHLSTTSGSLILRGDYDGALLASVLGRIDLGLPQSRSVPVELRASSAKGDVYVDVRKDQVWDVFFLGETHLLRCDPEVRAEWLENIEIDGVDYSKGRAGNLGGNSSGTL
ncbi:MAG: hypothetical protein ABL997_07785, partial [Planctomycetota bacterium]